MFIVFFVTLNISSSEYRNKANFLRHVRAPHFNICIFTLGEIYFSETFRRETDPALNVSQKICVYLVKDCNIESAHVFLSEF